ncbi:MAG: T9SS type A sorting domain-containing protein [Bacteroidota bacterium]
MNEFYNIAITKSHSMMRLCLLLLLAYLAQNSLQAQACTPDPAFENFPQGLYPAPFNADTRPNGGIDVPACAGQDYEFVFTLVGGDSVDIGNGTMIALESISLETVNIIDPDGNQSPLSSVGLSFACNPGSCTVLAGDIGCLVIRGTIGQDVTPGIYEFVFSGTVTIEGFPPSPVTLPDQVRFPGDAYFIEIRDADCTPVNCSLAVTTTTTPAECFTSSDGSATANVTGATGMVTYQWDDAAGNATSPTVDNLPQGTYSVTVSDESNCSVETTASVGASFGAVNFVVNKDSDASCSGGGQASVIMLEGTPPYTYEWSNGVTDSVATDLDEGEYFVTVTDDTDCSNIGSVVIEGTDEVLNITLSKTDVECNGDATGTASAAVEGGTDGVTFLWSNNETTNTITNLPAGEYTVTVTRGGCEVIDSVTIAQPDPIVITLTTQDSDCEGGNNGTAMASATGGNGGFSFTWDTGGGQSGPSIADIAPGDYNLTATDAEGCTASESFTISGADQGVSYTLDLTDATCNGDSDGSASVTIEGDDTGVMISWSTGETSDSIGNLVAGDYSVMVSDSVCVTSEDFTITQPDSIVVSIEKTDVSCDGATLGTATLTAGGGDGNFIYVWNIDSTGNSVSNLAIGTYIATVTDGNNCSQTTSVEIEQEELDLNTTTNITDVACNGEMSGRAEINVEGRNTGLTYLWSNSDTTDIIENVAAGDYTVTITNAEGCEYTETINIAEPDQLLVNIEAENATAGCSAGVPVALNASVSGGTATYDYLWSTNEVSASIGDLESTTYFVTVTDANGCIATDSLIVTADNNVFATNTNITEIECNGEETGVIQILASGGSGNYTYQWSANANAGNVAIAPTLGADTYMVTVSDSESCSDTLSITLDEPDPISYTTILTDASCAGLSDGTISVIPSGGTMPYTFTWQHDGMDTSSFEGLAAGTYSFIILDVNDCSLADSITIGEPDAITINTRSVGGGCGGTAPTAIIAEATGGNGDYSYEWSDGTMSNTLSSPETGTVTVSVTDASGCTASLEIEVTDEEVPLVLGIEKTDVDCNDDGQDNGTASVMVSGGSGNYNFMWSTGGMDATITGLGAGTYTVTVTDDTQCIDSISVEVLAPTPFSINLGTSNPRCADEENGRITLTTSRGTIGDFTYAWSDGADTPSRNNISAGTYSVTVVETATNCTISESVELTAPAAIRIDQSSLINVDCAGNMNGEIGISTSGGVGTLSVLWSTGASDNTITGLAGGEYIVTVTDRDNCSAVRTFTIQEPEPLEVEIQTVPSTNIDGGIATAVVMGGTPGYTYSWEAISSGPIDQTGSSVDDLLPGNYLLSVTDSRGCTAVETFVLEFSACESNIELTLDSEPTDCGMGFGSVSVVARGGIGPYTYVWSTQDSTTTVDSLEAGSYSVTVFDNLGCGEVGSVDVINPADFVISISNTPVSCGGANDGRLNAIPSGPGPFTFQWSTGATTQMIDSLPPGRYTVSVRNGAGCERDRTVEVLGGGGEIEAEITSRVNVSCPGDTDGSTSIAANGGVGPYTYNWERVSDGARFEGDTLLNLETGTYLVTATDASGCTATTSVEIGEPEALVAEVLVNNVLCAGDSTGTAGVNPEGGVTPYEYAWSTGDSIQGIFDLPAGSYILSVTDARGCETISNFEITESDPIVITEVSITPESAPGADDGMAEISVTGGNGPYTYAWEDGENDSATATDLSPGLQDVTVTDVNGCTAVYTVNINEEGCSLSGAVVTTDVLCSGEQDGTATVNISGESGDVDYAWSENSELNEATITGLEAGVYAVTVTDDSGCPDIIEFTIDEPSAIQLEVEDVVNLDCDGNGGTATASASGGTGTLTYAWSTGSNTAMATDLEEGENTVTVTDENGCEATMTVNIERDFGDDFNANVEANDVSCGDASDGSATITVTGGGDFTFDWPAPIDSESNTAEGLAVGEYEVTISDAGGCSTTVTVTIEGVPALEALTTVINPVVCRGDSSAVISTEVQGGTADYSFMWSDGSDDAQLENVAAGTYGLTITDANGCTVELEREVTEPNDTISITIESTNETVENAEDGAARAIASGGTGNYQYAWSFQNTQQEFIANVPPGEYTVTVTDDNGCEAIATVIIEAAESICNVQYTLEISTTSASCDDLASGRAEVVSVSEEGTFTYEWSNGDLTAVADSLTPGEYLVTVTDELGCFVEDSVVITTPDSLELLANVTGIGCEGSNDGSAALEVSGGTAPFSYTWSIDTLDTSVRDTLAAGEYFVTVTDANGCTDTLSFAVEIGEDNTPPTFDFQELTVFLDEFGEASFEMMDILNSVSDNCGLDTVIMMADTSIFSCENLGVNRIPFMATDERGNVAMDTAIVIVADTIAPFLDCLNQDTLITDCLADRTISFELPQVLDNCGQTLTPSLLSGLESGATFPAGITEQVFEVMDSSGNIATCSFTVNIDVLGVEITQVEPTCANFSDGSLSASATNAEGNVFYTWSTGDDMQEITGLSAGDYQVTVIDEAGCSRVEMFTLTEPDPLRIIVDSIAMTTEELSTGAIFVTIEGGSQPYNFQWVFPNGSIITQVQDLVNVGLGEYRLTVFDANGCTVVSDLLSTDTTFSSTNVYEVDYEVSLHPNPTSGRLFFNITQDKARTYQVSLYDMTGRLVRTLAREDSRLNEREFDLSDLGNGMYFIRVQVEDQILTKRIVVMKD